MTQKYGRCKYPECAGNVIEAKELGLCKKHMELLKFFLWALENVKMKDSKTTNSGLVLP